VGAEGRCSEKEALDAEQGDWPSAWPSLVGKTKTSRREDVESTKKKKGVASLVMDLDRWARKAKRDQVIASDFPWCSDSVKPQMRGRESKDRSLYCRIIKIGVEKRWTRRKVGILTKDLAREG